MSEALFQGTSVISDRIIYTPSGFARNCLLHLQEVGHLQATRPHTSHREGLRSYLFFIVEQGAGEVSYQESVYKLRRGDCVFLDCQKPYSHTSSADALWSLRWAHFSGPTMSGIYEKYVERGGDPVFHSDDIDSYSSLLADLQTTAAAEDYIRDMRINEKITALLTCIMAESWHPESSKRAAVKKKSLQHVKTYLEEHYQERITLDQLAEQFYINKFYLTRVFKEQFGTTILAYLDHVRITHAKHLLRFSDKTTEEIGRAVGIEEPGYFNRVFKKVEGVTPGEYRKMW